MWLLSLIIPKLGLKPKPHPQPFKPAWVNNPLLPVTQRCLVFVQLGDYSDRIWCDVLSMDVAHILPAL